MTQIPMIHTRIFSLWGVMFFFSTVLFAQEMNRLPRFQHIVNQTEHDTTREWTVVVVSHTHCGHCHLALERFYKAGLHRRARVMVYEYGGIRNIEKYLLDTPYFDSFLFIDAEMERLKEYDNRFFPVFFIYHHGRLKKNKRFREEYPVENFENGGRRKPEKMNGV